MTYFGTIQNGVVVFENASHLPDGTPVQVIVNAETRTPTTLRERLAKLAGTVNDLPPDMASNHDHYIHGAPRK